MNKSSNIMMIQGQPAIITFEAEIGAFRGKFINVSGYCDFVADSISGLQREGEISLAEYLQDCREEGIEPFREEQQERLTVRVSGRLGARLTAVAKQHAMSKNQLIVEVLERELALV
ncbi:MULTISPECIES: type II toxin-antitoxin system HicB family antitoxin [unclassified Leclercia]|uniref:Type II toxin-antitoxin system HicB family antitoxin n=1 Tax=Leclercia barmai TaxID=2785629 RepID=A0ABS7RY54_9ENTR|nr:MULTISPECIES: type II toxin-antitoxin system HicB family antitoxin [unclassified Leclercia]MBZ0058700.1 type II toxin-antitoxin system HicB family antitoxin [Leclercia sp. EMC7]MCM5696110.1 type II toxin-antitoxin system HicB family antitoxin [Leclercia sp. LTM01]MCM5702357.1 type II toxin-antitoxin system HicB family antitoxin [Leclercia sp. LTM14]